MSEMEGSTDAACDGWDNSSCVGTSYCPPRCPRYVDRTGTAYVIRPFQAGDFAALVAMYESLDPSLRTMGLPPAGRGTLEWWLTGLTEDGWNLVAVRDDEVVGHIGVAPADADEPEFVIFVHQDRQGRGIGTELVKQAVAYAADSGHDALTLSVSTGNRRAVRVYENVGFERSETAPHPTTVEVEMGLPMDSAVAERVRRPPAERGPRD